MPIMGSPVNRFLDPYADQYLSDAFSVGPDNRYAGLKLPDFSGGPRMPDFSGGPKAPPAVAPGIKFMGLNLPDLRTGPDKRFLGLHLPWDHDPGQVAPVPAFAPSARPVVLPTRGPAVAPFAPPAVRIPRIDPGSPLAAQMQAGVGGVDPETRQAQAPAPAQAAVQAPRAAQASAPISPPSRPAAPYDNANTELVLPSPASPPSSFPWRLAGSTQAPAQAAPQASAPPDWRQGGIHIYRGPYEHSFAVAPQPRVGLPPAPASTGDPVADFQERAMAAARVPFSPPGGAEFNYGHLANQEAAWNAGLPGREAEAMAAAGKFAATRAGSEAQRDTAAAHLSQARTLQQEQDYKQSDAGQQFALDAAAVRDGQQLRGPAAALQERQADTLGMIDRMVPGAVGMDGKTTGMDEFLRSRELRPGGQAAMSPEEQAAFMGAYGKEAEPYLSQSPSPGLLNAIQHAINGSYADLGGVRKVTPWRATQGRLGRQLGLRYDPRRPGVLMKGGN